MRYEKVLFILVIISILFGVVEVKALEVVELNPIMQKGETKDIELYVNVPSNTK